MDIKIKKLSSRSKYINDLFNLILLLWPDTEEKFDEIIMSKNNHFCGAFLGDKIIGFINYSIRYEYVNGSSISPVGYLEGIYILEEYRRNKVATKLVDFVYEQLKSKGYKELASDTLLDNYEGQEFHKSIGFKERERVVYYIKKIK